MRIHRVRNRHPPCRTNATGASVRRPLIVTVSIRHFAVDGPAPRDQMHGKLNRWTRSIFGPGASVKRQHCPMGIERRKRAAVGKIGQRIIDHVLDRTVSGRYSPPRRLARLGEARLGLFLRATERRRHDFHLQLRTLSRADAVFKASDYRSSTFEAESVLIEHPAVAEAAAVPRSDPLRLAVPLATGRFQSRAFLFFP